MNSLLLLSFKCSVRSSSSNKPYGKETCTFLIIYLIEGFYFFSDGDCVSLLKSGHTKSGVYSVNPDGRGFFAVY